MDKKRVLGFDKFMSKLGKPFVKLHVASPFTGRESKNGSVGEKVEQLFVPEECHDKVVPSIIGKEISLDYEINNGKAYLIGFEVCK